jgi:hypothetical protein
MTSTHLEQVCGLIRAAFKAKGNAAAIQDLIFE